MHIVIDGNIGSGKTTQLNLLEQSGWFVKREPLDEWPLELFYKDMSRWALLLQIKILQTIQPRDETTVYERCLLSTRFVFWEYLVQKKLVTPEEDAVYQNVYTKYAWYPDVYIYLAKTPETAHEHIKKRHQTGDDSVSLEYLRELHVLYEKMIKNVPCKVYIVTTKNRTPESIHEEIKSILSRYNKNELHSNHKKRPEMPQRSCLSHTQNTNMCCVS